MTNNRGALTVALVLLLGGVGTRIGRGEPSQRKQTAAARTEYRIDARKSRFIVETETSGLSSTLVHDHKLEITEFSGVAGFTPGALSSASLQITARAGSLRLIEEKTGDPQTIESILREDVLETGKYPEISFKTRSVTSGRRGDGTYDVRLNGQLNLHGVRRQVTIPVRVSLEPDSLHAIGVFQIRQSDFDITPFSFVSGTVTVKDNVTISFDIVAKPVAQGLK